MNPLNIIDKYYTPGSALHHILLTHSEQVARKALDVAERHPELNLDTTFLREAALLHDIGIYLTDAPSIHCTGTAPYIAHGYLGAELMRREGYPRHALVCERHTGTGIPLSQIIAQNLPLPHRDLMPVSLEEQVICFADKFYSKSHLDKERSIEKVRQSISRYGEEGLTRFDKWYERFM
ncbi:MAG: HDIG domain-containing protein [Prevotellaceae bacterium]|jgi:uncharacterized protein|nr:HDIG domain-containing protein [Prevotellaceae bacterium]